jgi:hypothetical protein
MQVGQTASMARFVYTVWFRNSAFPPDDQDHEWPACFTVEAGDAVQALSWGDTLARGYVARGTEQQFLWSTVDAVADGDNSHTLPVILFGQDASDGEIGW